MRRDAAHSSAVHSTGWPCVGCRFRDPRTPGFFSGHVREKGTPGGPRDSRLETMTGDSPACESQTYKLQSRPKSNQCSAMHGFFPIFPWLGPGYGGAWCSKGFRGGSPDRWGELRGWEFECKFVPTSSCHVLRNLSTGALFLTVTLG